MAVSRDSAVWWLAIVGAVIGYLTSAHEPPTIWHYSDWLQAISFLVGLIAAKLSTSPLDGDGQDTHATVDVTKVGKP